MAVKPLHEGYIGEVKDRVENYGGNYIVHIGWDHHMLYAAPQALVLSPDLPFAEFLQKVMPESFAAHPDFATIDWSGVQWKLNGAAFEPVPEKTLKDLGVRHKSVIRFDTPGAMGIGNAGV